MMLLKLLMENRSYRSFQQDFPVFEQDLLDMVSYTRLTASAANRQPLKYRLVHQKQEVSLLAPQLQWAKGLPDWSLPPQGHYPPAYIVICHDTTIEPDLQKGAKDVGIVAQTLLLAATEKELGGCMIGSFDAVSVQNTLELAQHLVPVLVLAIGKPDEICIVTEASQNVAYFRDDQGVHYVPKRSMQEIVIAKGNEEAAEKESVGVR